MLDEIRTAVLRRPRELQPQPAEGQLHLDKCGLVGLNPDEILALRMVRSHRPGTTGIKEKSEDEIGEKVMQGLKLSRTWCLP